MSISQKEAEEVIREDKAILRGERAVLRDLRQGHKGSGGVNKINFLFVFIILLLVAVAFVAFDSIGFGSNRKVDIELANKVAACLTERGATMYGASWCSHCNDQKKIFGPAFDLVDYVECPQNEQFCLERGVVSYPTWVMGEQKIGGARELGILADWAGCDIAF
jgi:hypothetical protein